MTSTSRPTRNSPNANTPATLHDLIRTQSALADLLARETELMERMNIADAAILQPYKLDLSAELERILRYLQNHMYILQAATSEEKKALEALGERFRKVTKKNYDTLLVARAVNRSIVDYVTQSFTQKTHNPVYNAHGAIGKYKPAAVSITLNQTI